MAITTITNSMVSVNAIQGTLIADNAITAVHIASNAVASIQIAENNVTAREIAANTITVTQLADDCVESDKIADGVITTNHLNKAMISSQTEVAVATGDFILLGDTSDSNNLKKAPISSILAGTLTTAAQTNITSLGTLTALTVDDITLNGSTLSTPSSLTLDLGGNLTINVDGTVVSLSDDAVNFGQFYNSSSGQFNIYSPTSNKDMVFRGNDNGSGVNALTLDMSDAGAATFNNGVVANASGGVSTLGANGHVTSKQSLDTETAGGRFIGESNRGHLGDIGIEQTATSTDGGYIRFATSASGSTSSTTHMTLASNGKLGLHSGLADTQLHVKNTGGIEVRLEADSNNNGQEDCFIRFYTDGKTQEGIAGMDNNNSSTLFSGNTENAMVFGTVSNLPVVLATNNTERFQISAAGNVGINNTSPAQKLHVGGGVRFSTTPTDGNETRFNFGIGGAADDPTLVIYRHDGSSESVRFQPGSHIYFENKLLVGTTSTTGMSGNGIESNGSIRANNYILSTDLVGSGYRNLNARPDGIITTSTSLRELKENITDMSLGLSDVLKLKPREFDWKKTPEGKNAPSIEGDTEDIGFIADEVFDVSPKLATYKVGDKTKDNLQGVKYDTMTSLLVKAIQELEARVKELEG